MQLYITRPGGQTNVAALSPDSLALLEFSGDDVAINGGTAADSVVRRHSALSRTGSHHLTVEQ
jgi:hypothetical protein